MDNKLEFRVQQINLTTDNDTMIVEGLVNKTETWSQMLGTVKKFKEKIVKGAFQRAIDNAPCIDFLAEHDKTKLLATTSNDSLELFEDEEGLKMRARIVPTAYGKDFYTLIKERIINHMSFGFSVVGQDFKRLADGTYERTVTDLKLFEVSAVRNPAYLASSISARGIDIVEEIDIPDEIDSLDDVEDRGISDELLEGILKQLKTNNELLASLNINANKPQDVVKDEPTEDEPTKVVEPEAKEDVQTEDKTDSKKDDVVGKTSKDDVDNEVTKDDNKDVVSEPVKTEVVEPEVKQEPEVKEGTTPKVDVKTVDLSTHKNILNEIMEGEQ